MRPLSDELDRGYLKQFLQSRLFQDQIEAWAAGSAQINYGPTHLKQMFIVLPPLSEQRAIAGVLGALDDKIELNRRMNQTLEEIARTIFTSWFVRFDPVRSKAAGRQPEGMDAETAALFPDAFVDSELGPIPAGWQVVTLGAVIDLKYGKALKADVRLPGSVPVYGSNGIVGWHNEWLVAGPGIVVGRKGNPGTVTWSSSSFFPIDTTFYVVPKTLQNAMPFLFFTMANLNLPHFGADSAVPGINRNTALSLQFVMPDHQMIDRFNELAKGLFTLRDNYDSQAVTLTEIRDTLLPKLLSGELRVPMVERTLAEVGA